MGCFHKSRKGKKIKDTGLAYYLLFSFSLRGSYETLTAINLAKQTLQKLESLSLLLHIVRFRMQELAPARQQS